MGHSVGVLHIVTQYHHRAHDQAAARQKQMTLAKHTSLYQQVTACTLPYLCLDHVRAGNQYQFHCMCVLTLHVPEFRLVLPSKNITYLSTALSTSFQKIIMLQSGSLLSYNSRILGKLILGKSTSESLVFVLSILPHFSPLS